VSIRRAAFEELDRDEAWAIAPEALAVLSIAVAQAFVESHPGSRPAEGKA